MENALLLNGVYEGVLEEIIQSQENNPGKVFYLQPYSASAIKQLKSNPPEMDSTVPLYLSTTNQLNQICYVAVVLPVPIMLLTLWVYFYHFFKKEIYFL